MVNLQLKAQFARHRQNLFENLDKIRKISRFLLLSLVVFWSFNLAIKESDWNQTNFYFYAVPITIERKIFTSRCTKFSILSLPKTL